MAKFNPELQLNPRTGDTVYALGAGPKPDPAKLAGAQNEDDATFGVFKFRGVMKKKYFDYCFSGNLDMNDVTNQTNFLIKQLREDNSLRGSELKEAKTVEQAALIIHQYILKDTSGLQNTIDTAYDLLDRNSA